MKKGFLLAAVLTVLALAGQASAQQTIYMHDDWGMTYECTYVTTVTQIADGGEAKVYTVNVMSGSGTVANGWLIYQPGWESFTITVMQSDAISYSYSLMGVWGGSGSQAVYAASGGSTGGQRLWWGPASIR